MALYGAQLHGRFSIPDFTHILPPKRCLLVLAYVIKFYYSMHIL